MEAMLPSDLQETASLPWHDAPGRWGHPLHSLCSYMAMFPPSMPHVFIKWLTNEGDVVYDPFSGRGTTALEACALGRIGMGSDLNPLAHVLTSAKTDPPSWESLSARIDEIEVKITPLPSEREPVEIRGIFDPDTLGQLLWLRVNLNRDRREDVFILAALLGILHLNADSRGRPKGLSVSMPNTFAMAPGYVLNYIEEHDLRAPKADVVQLLRSRVNKYRAYLDLPCTGRSWMQNASMPGPLERSGSRARLVFCSPPYLHVIKYGKFNWIRLWLLGETPKAVDETLFSTSSLTRYLDFMSSVLGRLVGAVQEDGYACLVIGDVTSSDKTIRLAEQVAERCLPSGLILKDIIADELPGDRKVSRIWGETRGRATKTDRILVLGGRTAGPIPSVPSLTW